MLFSSNLGDIKVLHLLTLTTLFHRNFCGKPFLTSCYYIVKTYDPFNMNKSWTKPYLRVMLVNKIDLNS